MSLAGLDKKPAPADKTANLDSIDIHARA